MTSLTNSSLLREAKETISRRFSRINSSKITVRMEWV